MNIDSKVAILCITSNGCKLACKMKALLNYGDVYFINNKKDENVNKGKEISEYIEDGTQFCTVRKRLKVFVEDIFDKYEYIIFIMAAGIVVRTIAPLVTSKFSDPAILVTDEKGTNIISLLSGHMGGANEMTLHLSKLLECNPVITTATDTNEKSSLDMIAKKLNAHIDDFRDNVLLINSMLVNNNAVGLYLDGEYDNVDTRGFTVLCNSKSINEHLKEKKELSKINCNTIVVISNKDNLQIDEDLKDKYKIIKVIPKNMVVGIGCRRNTESDILQESLEDFFSKNNIDINSIKEIGSIDVKKDEKAIIDLSKNLKVPFKFLSKEDISKVDNLFGKSEWVKKSVGVYSVAEPVAHILSKGNLIVKKSKYKGITFSVGRLKI